MRVSSTKKPSNPSTSCESQYATHTDLRLINDNMQVDSLQTKSSNRMIADKYQYKFDNVPNSKRSLIRCYYCGDVRDYYKAMVMHCRTEHPRKPTKFQDI